MGKIKKRDLSELCDVAGVEEVKLSNKRKWNSKTKMRGQADKA